MSTRRSLIALLLAALAGCKDPPREAGKAAAPATGTQSARPDPQTFDEAMRIACDAPEQAELPPESSGAANRAMVLAAWLDARVRNAEVRQLMGATDSPRGKLDALRAGARRAGISRCALAEMWESSGGSPGSLSSEPQTYDEAIAILCSGPADDAALGTLVREKVKNSEVATLFSSLAQEGQADRARLLREAAGKTGVASCPLADKWADPR